MAERTRGPNDTQRVELLGPQVGADQPPLRFDPHPEHRSAVIGQRRQGDRLSVPRGLDLDGGQGAEVALHVADANRRPRGFLSRSQASVDADPGVQGRFVTGHAGECIQTGARVDDAHAVAVRFQPQGQLSQVHVGGARGAVGARGDGDARIGDGQRPRQDRLRHGAVGGGADPAERGGHRALVARQLQVRHDAGQLDPVYGVDRAARAQQRAQRVVNPQAARRQQHVTGRAEQLQVADLQCAQRRRGDGTVPHARSEPVGHLHGHLLPQAADHPVQAVARIAQAEHDGGEQGDEHGDLDRDDRRSGKPPPLASPHHRRRGSNVIGTL